MHARVHLIAAEFKETMTLIFYSFIVKKMHKPMSCSLILKLFQKYLLYRKLEISFSLADVFDDMK